MVLSRFAKAATSVSIYEHSRDQPPGTAGGSDVTKLNGYLHTTAVFSAELALAARQESLSKVQAGGCSADCSVVGYHRRRDRWNRVSHQSAGLRPRLARLTSKVRALIVSRFGPSFRFPLVQRCNWFCRCGGVARLDAWHRSFKLLWRKARILHDANAANGPAWCRDATEKLRLILGYWEAKSAPA
jgi:hypothetical protein